MSDPKKLQEEMALVQRNLAALQKAEQAMRNPYKRQQVRGGRERLTFRRMLRCSVVGGLLVQASSRLGQRESM